MISLTQSKLVFLFGSGASIPAGMPSTKCITEEIISGRINPSFARDEESLVTEPKSKHLPRILKFLERLKTEIDRYYEQLGRCANYEDLYYVANQIHDSENKNYDNPAVQPFIDKISPDIKYLLVSDDEDSEGWELGKLAEEATRYIKDVVWELLKKEPKRIDYLNILKDAFLDKQLSSIDIFTLNHDRVLESYLWQNKIKFTNGFGKPVNRVKYWDPDLFESESFKVRLFKLHGSIDWFRFRPPNGDWSNESIGIPLDNDLWYTINPQRQMQRPVSGQPEFLMGTFNKMFEYISKVYDDLFCCSHRALRDAHRLVICGYSFGDKGINTRIINWMYSSAYNKILVVHRDTEKLKNGARGAISGKWDKWKKEDKLTIIHKTIECLDWADIKKFLI